MLHVTCLSRKFNMFEYTYLLEVSKFKHKYHMKEVFPVLIYQI
jgi:hypothetical protein